MNSHKKMTLIVALFAITALAGGAMHVMGKAVPVVGDDESRLRRR